MEVSYAGLLVVGMVAVAAPLIATIAQKLRLPSPAIEILLGILVGPQVLDWVAADDVVVDVVSSLGVAFLLFLAGLELDLNAMRDRRGPVLGSYAITLVLAVPVAVGLGAIDLHDEPAFLAVALIATSLGLVVPILRDTRQLETTFGQTVLGNSSLGEFVSILFLSLFFSTQGTSPRAQSVLLGVFVATVVVAALALTRAGRSISLSRTVLRLEDTSAQLGVRVAMALLLLFVALSGDLGLEVVLGSFVAGALLRMVDPEARFTHDRFMVKVEGLGYGFLIPAFFVATGIDFDVEALFAEPQGIVLLPCLVLGLLVVRGLPALWYRREMGTRRAAAAGLLQATSLSFLVVAASVGTEIGTIDSDTAAALVGAGLVSAVLFPPVALALLGRSRGAGMPERWWLPGMAGAATIDELAEVSDPRKRPPLTGVDVAELRVVTANVRFANPFDGEDAWPLRREHLAEAVRALEPHVIGFQEALAEQVDDLVELLPDHDWYGEGRDDGELGGEFSPIFFLRRRFDPVAAGTFWLSDEPDRAGSRLHGTQHPRIATWVRLLDRWTGTELVVANTHLDHARSDHRVRQAEVLVERLLPLGAEGPLVLLGDLNDGLGSPVHELLCEAFRDTRAEAEVSEGPDTTFNRFARPQAGHLIDHVFVLGALDVDGLRVVDEQIPGGRYPSDHFPVLARLRLVQPPVS